MNKLLSAQYRIVCWQNVEIHNILKNTNMRYAEHYLTKNYQMSQSTIYMELKSSVTHLDGFISTRCLCHGAA